MKLRSGKTNHINVSMANVSDIGSSQASASQTLADTESQLQPSTTGGPTGSVPASEDTSVSASLNVAHYKPPTFDGINDHYLPWIEVFDAHKEDMNLGHVETQDNPDPAENKKLYYTLIKCLPYKCIQIVSANAKHNGKLALSILKDHYLGDVSSRRRVALQEAANIKWNEEDTYQTYTTRLDVLKAKLSSLGLLNEPQLIVSAMTGLPKKYSQIKIHLIGDDTITTYAQVKQKIISQISRQEQDRPTSQTPQVMNVVTPFYNQQRPHHRGSRPYRGGAQRFRGGPQRNHPYHNPPSCTYCGKLNHNYSNCYKRLQEESSAGATPGRRGRGNSHVSGARGRGRGGYNHRGNTRDTPTHTARGGHHQQHHQQQQQQLQQQQQQQHHPAGRGGYGGYSDKNFGGYNQYA